MIGLLCFTIAAFVIDRNFTRASAFALASAGLTFFGFMHGEAIGVAQSPLVTMAYLGVAAVLFGCAKLATVTAPATEEHRPVAGEAHPTPAE